MQGNAYKKLMAGKKYLLLQGPMGPFFSDLADWLELNNREAVNVVFNGADRFYCRQRKYLTYSQTPQEFSTWLSEVYHSYDFDTVLCFGDCRPLHQAAKKWAEDKDVRFIAVEEGYLRPHFITLEEGGVNGYSSMPRDPDFYRNLPEIPIRQIKPLKPSTSLRVMHAIGYYVVGWYYRNDFPLYKHHKSFSLRYKSKCWFRAFWRKYWYALQQRNILPRLQTELDQRYYLAVLQVYNDSQIKHHSPYNDVRDYITEVITSFAHNAPADKFLVIKHHPMDRGHRLYGPMIDRLSNDLRINGRVIYIHDLPLPQLLSHTIAVITINSTVGISALIHHKPLKVMGNAFYDIKGITFQKSIDEFWNADYQLDRELFDKFRRYILDETQINIVNYGGEFSTEGYKQ